jgi:hypothetical protein
MATHVAGTTSRQQLEEHIYYLQTTLAILKAQLDAQGETADILVTSVAASDTTTIGQGQSSHGNLPQFEGTPLAIAAG